MATKSNIKVARELLERFFRDAEGRTNRQLDVYFTLQDLGLPREKSDPALEYLTSRGLINTFGPDIAYLTDKGAQAIIEDLDIGSLSKEIREFGKQGPPPPHAQPQQQRQVQPVEEEEEEAPKTKRPPAPQVTHIDPEGKEYVLPLGRVCTIGRSPGNDIQVNDQRASKRHAEIRWENGRYMMVDLGSANGTLLNGEYTDQAVLEHDDELVIGRTMLIFQCPEGKLPQPPEKVQEEESTTDDVGTEVARALAQGRTERPVVVESRPQHYPPPSLPPPSVPPPLKVVKGRPEIVHQETPRMPSRANELAQRVAPLVEERRDDLFAEEPTPEPTNLFGDTERGFDPGRPRAPSSDLFQQEELPEEDADLFQDEPTPVRKKHDLFVPPSALNMSDEETVGSADQIRIEEAAPIERSADLPSLEPIEELPNDRFFEPMVPDGVRSLEAIPEERTVAESPAAVPPDYEVSDPEIPAFTNWDGVTNDDVLLENQPVISEIEVPEIPDIREPSPRKDEDAATLMVSRDDLFAHDAPLREDLARWGEERPILESHPEFAVADQPAHGAGEVLPVASHSVVNLRVASTPGRDPAEAARGMSFHKMLAAIRERAQLADLPDREELLGAIDLLEHHAYVRVALAMIEREDR